MLLDLSKCRESQLMRTRHSIVGYKTGRLLTRTSTYGTHDGNCRQEELTRVLIHLRYTCNTLKTDSELEEQIVEESLSLMSL